MYMKKLFKELNEFVIEKLGNKKYICASELKLNNFQEFVKLMQCYAFGLKQNSALLFNIDTDEADELVTIKVDNVAYSFREFSIELFYDPEFAKQLFSFIKECKLHDEYYFNDVARELAHKLDSGTCLDSIYKFTIDDIEKLLCFLKFVNKLRDDKNELTQFVKDHCKYWREED